MSLGLLLRSFKGYFRAPLEFIWGFTGARWGSFKHHRGVPTKVWKVAFEPDLFGPGWGAFAYLEKTEKVASLMVVSP